VKVFTQFNTMIPRKERKAIKTAAPTQIEKNGRLTPLQLASVK